MQPASGSVDYEGESQDINKQKSDSHEKVPGSGGCKSALLRHLLCQSVKSQVMPSSCRCSPHIFFKSYAQEWKRMGQQAIAQADARPSLAWLARCPIQLLH
jgi:hypothetical protein